MTGPGAPAGFPDAFLTPHAREQLRRRAIDGEAVLAVAAAPEQVIPVRRGRVAAQSRERIAGRSALLRVIIDLDGPRPAIVTACRTTRVAKYWSTE